MDNIEISKKELMYRIFIYVRNIKTWCNRIDNAFFEHNYLWLKSLVLD
ncbi:hypothetical protein ALC53_04863 [Atta colombica]|uniref:Uncharacterized protein n=1 Tax=Atta colombica TaxID=520822 RepID=A0A195BKD4_9HYME|nr:hypothetical protein ALC53_04863 [Atta colombica]